MSFQQFQTAAVRIFRLSDATDRDLSRLPWPLHPHDAEAILQPIAKPSIDQYAGTTILRFPWARYVPEQNDLVGTEMTLLWRGGDLVVAARGQANLVEACMDDCLQDAAGQKFTGPADVVAQLLWQIGQVAQATVREFHQSVAPTSQDMDAQRLAILFKQQAEILTSVQAIENAGISPTTALRLKLIAHQFRHLHQTVTQHPRSIMRPADAPKLLMPKVATGYMLASATIIVLVLIAVAS